MITPFGGSFFGIFLSFYEKEDSDDPENLAEIVKDALKIKGKVEEDGVGYLRFCLVKQIEVCVWLQRL